MSSSRGARRAAVVPAWSPPLTAMAGIAYGAWVTQFALNPRLDAVNGYVSELSASDQPFHVLFSGADLLTGVLTGTVAGAVLRALRPSGWALTGWLALMLFGAFSIGDALLAMDCAPNSDTTCALRERAGAVSFAHRFHSVTSMLVVAAGVLSLIALTVAARRGRRWPVLARWSGPVTILEIVAALGTLPMMYFGIVPGLVERVQVTVVSVWLLVIAAELSVHRRYTRSTARTGPDESSGANSAPDTAVRIPRARATRGSHPSGRARAIRGEVSREKASST